MNSSIADYLAQLAARDVKLWAEDGKLKVNAPQGVLTPELQRELAARKPELLAFFAQRQAAARPSGIPHRNKERTVPLTQGQERIWSLAKMEPGSSVYNVPTVFRLSGSLDLAALEKALAEIERRHEVLRTTFPGTDAGDARQEVHAARDSVLKVTTVGNELRGLPPDQAQRELARMLNREVRRPFDLEKGPLWRARLFRLAPKQSLLALTMHHIVFDGLSKTVFLDELGAAYAAFAAGNAPELPRLDVQFADFAAWQREQLDDAALARQLEYWKSRFSGEVAALAIPNDRARPPGKGRAGSIHFELPARMTRSAMDLSRQEQASAFIVFLTGFIALLHRYSGQEDIVLCAPMASRDRAEIEKLIGYFNNIVALRADVSGNPSFRSLLAQVRRLAVEAYDNQYVPLQRLAQLPNLVRTPLTRAMFSYQESNSHRLGLSDIEARAVNVRKGAADFDLAMYTEYAGDKLTGVLDYNADIFSVATIKKFLQRFGQVLGFALGDPERRMQDLPAYGKKPANLEALLTRHAQIDQAVVVPLPKTGQYVAYLVLNEHDVPTLEAVRAYTAANLPDYKVPVAFIPVDEMPLQPDGSVDVAALPAAGRNRGRLHTKYAAPRSELERRLAEIWKKVLWLDFEVGIHDRFRDLGGHSLLSVQLVVELEKALQRRVPAKALAELNTIAELAEALESTGQPATEPQPDTRAAGSRLPADIYHGLRSHTASWEGKRTTPESVTVGLNTDGSRQALFWCLQRYQELTQLARYLGPAQPVYGMRSGNRVMVKSQENITLLAAHYVGEILATQPEGPYLIGGNCQAALIAFSIARELRDRGHEITLLILQEKFIPTRYDGPVALLFGDRSDYNPHRYFRHPEMGWHKYYSGPVALTIVPGAHGQFFREPNVQALTAAIGRHIAAAQGGRLADSPTRPPDHPTQILPSNAYRARLRAPAELTMREGEARALLVEVVNGGGCTWEASETSGVFLANRWLGQDGQVLKHLDGRAPLRKRLDPGEAAMLEITVNAPAGAGQRILEIDLVEEGVTWFREQGSLGHRVKVEVQGMGVTPSSTMEQA